MTRACTALFVIAAACGGGGGNSPAAQAKPPVSNKIDEPIVEESTGDGQPRIEILNVGAEPRTALRLKPTLGSSTGADVVVDLAMRGDALAQNVNVKFGWAGAVTSAPSPIRVENHIDSIVVNGAAIEHSRLGFQYTLLPTATVASFDVPADASEAEAGMAESARQMLSWLAVFPSAPVGIGARWQIETEYVRNGVPVAMTVTSELAARDGRHAKIQGSLVFRPPQAQPSYVEGSGQFEADFDLTRAVPSAKLTMVMNGRVEGAATFSGDSTMTLTPRR